MNGFQFYQLRFGTGQIIHADLRDPTAPVPPYEKGQKLLHVRYPNGCHLSVTWFGGGGGRNFSVDVYHVMGENGRPLYAWSTSTLSPELLADASARAQHYQPR